jgi:membrane-associated phospholipid phosphatase
LCYYFVDRPVATFVYEHKLSQHEALKWLTYPPPIVQAWTPVILVLLTLRWLRGSLPRWEKALFVACIAIVVADQFRESLAYVFGRYWPETWINDNPSFIGSGAYGFHPFHDGSWYGSFPSGHATRTVAAGAVAWLTWPRWRWLAVLASGAVAIGLVGMNYHFVGDVIAGSFLGAIVGSYAATYAELHAPSSGN